MEPPFSASASPGLTHRRLLFNSEIPLLEVLIKLLEEIYRPSLQDIGIQAGSDTGVSFYEGQLRRIDQKFQSKQLLDIESTRAAFEERIRHCRYEIEAELQKSYSEKLETFKKLRLEEMRQEVEAKMAEQFSAKRQQLEALHTAERARLDERERHLNELSQKSREVGERTAFLQRQALEAEIQAARAQTEKARAREMELERPKYASLLSEPALFDTETIALNPAFGELCYEVEQNVAVVFMNLDFKVAGTETFPCFKVMETISGHIC
ncbi:unnamed protein product [Dibothriocephalus latus]|uniref:Uncharacterized protein n=1 Tax=Dibothriocephalus latus TaxID=60516 RepID=A0A3P7LKQ3_DIBLA|nr:unnamed protein product [Dibothriocephalus latus]